MRKQRTIFLTESNQEKKLDYAFSGLCFIRDWDLGWFEVPFSMKKAFEREFDVTLSENTENSLCPTEITSSEIERINRANWGVLFWKYANERTFSISESAKKYIAEIKGHTYDNLFIKLKDEEGNIIGGASSWRQFEEITSKLREKAKLSGNEIEVSLSFAN